MITAGDGVALFAAALLMLGAAFFGAAQTALTHMSLGRAVKLEEDERSGARILVTLMQEPARTLNMIALGVLMLQVTGVALLTLVISRFLDGRLAVVGSALLASAVLYVGAEVAPKTYALQHTERVACVTARWVKVLGVLVAPFAALLVRLGNVVAPGRGLAEGPYVTEDHIREMLDTAESDEVEDVERQMIHSIFELGDTTVRDIMVPRPDMVVISADAALRDVAETLLRAGHSRMPVYRGDRDTIVGLIYAKDVLRRIHLSGREDGPWGHLLRATVFVPEPKRVDAMLRELQGNRVHMAIVVDEYGATAGLVTIEDILEEIVGEIVDEHDREDALVTALAADTYRVDARLPVAELARLLDVSLPEGDWSSVGGLLLGVLGRVPEPGERIDVDNLLFTAERIRRRRIGTVLVERRETAEAPAAP